MLSLCPACPAVAVVLLSPPFLGLLIQLLQLVPMDAEAAKLWRSALPADFPGVVHLGHLCVVARHQVDCLVLWLLSLVLDSIDHLTVNSDYLPGTCRTVVGVVEEYDQDEIGRSESQHSFSGQAKTATE